MNIRKKLLGLATIIGLSFAVFTPSTFMGSITHAQEKTTEQTTTNQSQTKSTIAEQALNEFWTFMDIVLKIIYMIIWPMLFLAGIALDNSMVYGSFFHMDAPLWSFWNITKNFANFALGFMVLFAILKSILSSIGSDKGSSARNPMEIIKKTLIAGILIQASWFIIAVLIDISTIATYAVWGLPMALLNDTKIWSGTHQIRQTESHLEFNNINKIQEEDFKIWYKTEVEKGNYINISPCLIKKLGSDSYIIGRKYWGSEFNSQSMNIQSEKVQIKTTDYPQRNVCIYANTPYFFNEFPNTNDKIDNDYHTTLLKNIEELQASENISNLEECWFIINLSKERNEFNCNPLLINVNIDESLKKEKDFQSFEKIFGELKSQDIKPGDISSAWGKTWFSQTLAPTVGQIIEKTKGFVGPFVTIYASIMDFANLSDGNSNAWSISKNAGNIIIKTFVAVGLVFPLIALAAILFIRIGFLRAVIAASPILVLVNVFKDTIKIDLKAFSLQKIIRAIFAPVITVFALSIAVIFMTTLSNALSTNNIEKINVMENLGWTIKDLGPETSMEIAGFTIIYPKVVDTYAGATGDWFSWLLLSFCGIGIMWFLVFAAVKAGDVTDQVASGIQKFGENVFKTTPIIPIGPKGVGFGTLSETMNTDTLNRMRENKVDYEGQKSNMQTYMEDKFSSAKYNHGTDKDFSPNEKYLVQNAIKTGDADTITNTLKKSWFLSDQQNIGQLYENSQEFKDMVKANPNNAGLTSLLGSTLAKEKVDESIKWSYKDENDLNEAIKGIPQETIKTLDEKYEKEVEVEKEGNKVSYIIKKNKDTLEATQKK